MFMFRNIYSISLSGSSLAGLIKRRYESLRLVLLLSKISICCSFLIPQALLCPWNHESLRFVLPQPVFSQRLSRGASALYSVLSMLAGSLFFQRMLGRASSLQFRSVHVIRISEVGVSMVCCMPATPRSTRVSWAYLV